MYVIIDSQVSPPPPLYFSFRIEMKWFSSVGVERRRETGAGKDRTRLLALPERRVKTEGAKGSLALVL